MRVSIRCEERDSMQLIDKWVLEEVFQTEIHSLLKLMGCCDSRNRLSKFVCSADRGGIDSDYIPTTDTVYHIVMDIKYEMIRTRTWGANKINWNAIFCTLGMFQLIDNWGPLRWNWNTGEICNAKVIKLNPLPIFWLQFDSEMVR